MKICTVRRLYLSQMDYDILFKSIAARLMNTDLVTYFVVLLHDVVYYSI